MKPNSRYLSKLLARSEIDGYLKRREMSGEELFSSEKLVIKLGANIAVSQTRPYLPPTIRTRDVVSQPRRVPSQPILVVAPAGYAVRAAGASDDEGKDQEREQEDDEYSHTDEVDAEEALLLPVRADEAGE